MGLCELSVASTLLRTWLGASKFLEVIFANIFDGRLYERSVWNALIRRD